MTTTDTPFRQNLLVRDFFPARDNVPFGEDLNRLFFEPLPDNRDFPIHGPNVIRLAQALFNDKLDGEPGLLSAADPAPDKIRHIYLDSHALISEALGLAGHDGETFAKMSGFIGIAALYHDIGKVIRRANHPQIGANLLRNFDKTKSDLLVNALQGQSESDESQGKHSRFSLICSITQHHDKFGVVSTGEGALSIFSDILYFTSDERMLPGILKNVTSVMVLNLADIAAVVPGTIPSEDSIEALRLAKQVGECRKQGGSVQEEDNLLVSLSAIIKKPTSCLGLKHRKVSSILSDWRILIKSIQEPEVRGNRARLKRRLLHHEQNPARTIERILRLLTESIDTSSSSPLLSVVSPTSVESVLVGALGSHQFQNFCQQFANIVKLDYGLNFFKGIVCACVRKKLEPPSLEDQKKQNYNTLTAQEASELNALPRSELQDVGNHVTALFVKVLNGLVNRYAGVLESGSLDARRFGFQMRDLTSDPNIRTTILRLLCVDENTDHVALTWIADEVSIWSMD
jgi:hypothetical protein